jgi:hypothetical protein
MADMGLVPGSFGLSQPPKSAFLDLFLKLKNFSLRERLKKKLQP